jgi:hypothetical protein
MEIQEYPKPALEQYSVLANQLDDLQRNENEGRGVSCVKSIVLHINRGEIEAAKAFCFTDADKINNYPEIKQFLISHLFKNERHPWTFSE